MKKEDLSVKSSQDLNFDLIGCRKELLAFRFQKAMNQLPNPAIIRQTKKKIARIKTFLNKN
jgi:large subunit ribosomal protein L29